MFHMNRRCFVMFWLIDWLICISLMWRINMWFLQDFILLHHLECMQLIKPLLIMEHFSISTGELCGFCPSNTWPMNHRWVVATQPEGGIQLEYSCYNRSLDVGHCVGNRTLVKTPKIQDERMDARRVAKTGGGVPFLGQNHLVIKFLTYCKTAWLLPQE